MVYYLWSLKMRVVIVGEPDNDRGNTILDACRLIKAEPVSVEKMLESPDVNVNLYLVHAHGLHEFGAPVSQCALDSLAGHSSIVFYSGQMYPEKHLHGFPQFQLSRGPTSRVKLFDIAWCTVKILKAPGPQPYQFLHPLKPLIAILTKGMVSEADLNQGKACVNLVKRCGIDLDMLDLLTQIEELLNATPPDYSSLASAIRLLRTFRVAP